MSWKLFGRRPTAVPPGLAALDDDALVALVRSSGHGFERAWLDEPEPLLAWLCAHARAFDRAADTKPALRAETGIAAYLDGLDGDGDGDDDDDDDDELAEERVDQWSLLGHGEQTYLYWDRSALPALRIVELDHERRMGSLVMHEWCGGRAAVLGLWARWSGVPGAARDTCYCSLAGHA